MSILKEKIDEIKQIKEDKLNYYNSVKELLNSLKKEINSLYSCPKENIFEIIKNVASYNYKINELIKFTTSFNFEDNAKNTQLEENDIKKLYLKLNEEKILENLTGNTLKKVQLHTNQILLDATFSNGYDTIDYYGLVKFSAYCDESVDINKFYSISEINNLISEDKLIICSNLDFDFNNKKLHNEEKDIKEDILENLSDINYPIELKNKIEFISAKQLESENNKIKNIINIEDILKFMDNFFYDDEIKDVIVSKIENINQSYSSVESILCASIIYEISNLLKNIEIEEENVKIDCKQKIKTLLNEVEKDLKQISEKELNN